MCISPELFSHGRNGSSQSDSGNDSVCCSICKSKASGKKLVVAIDGTNNREGPTNTHVVKINACVIQDSDPVQLTLYQSGIGTSTQKMSTFSLKHLLHILESYIDMAIAWNLKDTIITAYEWLSKNYKPGDQIWLFDRTAKGSAYELYKASAKKRQSKECATYFSWLDSTRNMIESFKRIFSQPEVKVHFLGAWDTVSAVGIFRQKDFPKTQTTDHVCYFRHALALDERRVKFSPEDVFRSSFMVSDEEMREKRTQDVTQHDAEKPQEMAPSDRVKEDAVGWDEILGKHFGSSKNKWIADLAARVDLDLIDVSHAEQLDSRLKTNEDLKTTLDRLCILASWDNGVCKIINANENIGDTLAGIMGKEEEHIDIQRKVVILVGKMALNGLILFSRSLGTHDQCRADSGRHLLKNSVPETSKELHAFFQLYQEHPEAENRNQEDIQPATFCYDKSTTTIIEHALGTACAELAVSALMECVLRFNMPLEEALQTLITGIRANATPLSGINAVRRLCRYLLDVRWESVATKKSLKDLIGTLDPICATLAPQDTLALLDSFIVEFVNHRCGHSVLPADEAQEREPSPLQRPTQLSKKASWHSFQQSFITWLEDRLRSEESVMKSARSLALSVLRAQAGSVQEMEILPELMSVMNDAAEELGNIVAGIICRMLDSDLRDRILDEQIFKNGLNTCLQKAEHSPKSILKIIEESMTTDHGRVMVANLGIEEDLRRISGTESIPQYLPRPHRYIKWWKLRLEFLFIQY
ncbi:predicted protein [Postia placenta Mad-698-R]|nr:predicted protein [Postia placenta Mad-698-R]